MEQIPRYSIVKFGNGKIGVVADDRVRALAPDSCWDPIEYFAISRGIFGTRLFLTGETWFLRRSVRSHCQIEEKHLNKLIVAVKDLMTKEGVKEAEVKVVSVLWTPED